MNLRNPSHIVAPDDPEPEALEQIFEARAIKVFDGDGFLGSIWHPMRRTWLGRIAFRFAFIDAPEMEQPFGAEAKAFLNRLISGRTLGLVPIGKQSTGGMPFDQYQRLLCMGYFTDQMQVGRVDYVRHGKCGTGLVKFARQVTRNIELEMIVNGCAWVVEQYSFDREAEYMAAQEDARCNRRGLWALDNPEPPWSFKRKQKRPRAVTERQPSLF